MLQKTLRVFVNTLLPGFAKDPAQRSYLSGWNLLGHVARIAGQLALKLGSRQSYLFLCLKLIAFCDKSRRRRGDIRTLDGGRVKRHRRLWKTVGWLLENLKVELASNPAISLLGGHPERMGSAVLKRELYTHAHSNAI